MTKTTTTHEYATKVASVAAAQWRNREYPQADDARAAMGTQHHCYTRAKEHADRAKLYCDMRHIAYDSIEDAVAIYDRLA